MTGKERVLKAFECNKTDQIPWVPFVGCHAGSLIGENAKNYLKSEKLMIKGLNEAIARYKPDGIPIAFDLQIEAETFGCQLVWAEDNPPSVATHPLEKGKTLADLQIPTKKSGRIPTILKVTESIRASHPDIALYGLITGPFTLALHLYGTNIFMSMYDNPFKTKELLEFCSNVAKAMSDYYIEAGCDIIAVVDPMTSQIGPDHFREFVTPFATPIFEHIHSQGAKSSFFVCGHAQQNIEAMCECSPQNISIDENIPLDFVRDICVAKGISYGGNLQLTTVLLLGSVMDAQRNAVECIEIGKGPGFILSPGCDLPYATPSLNLEGVVTMVRDESQREVIKNMASNAPAADLLNMSDYGKADKVIIDIITLDSEGCAPCQYMVEAVKEIAPEFEGIVEWREHKIKYRESLVFMTSLMVKNIPTICIDGKITFVSRIPPREEIVAAIQKRIFEKFRMKIQRRKASLFILGDGKEKCQAVQKEVEKAIRELGADVEVAMITDEKTIYSYGISPVQTPAVVLAKYQLKSVRSIPDREIIKEWIKSTGV
jgi:MtaA/CmuA family methyltransferase